MFDFGMNLRALREKKHMTQRRLAAVLSLSVATVSKYESNQVTPPLETLRHLATVLNVPMDELCGTGNADVISLTGLSPKQAELLQALAEYFREDRAPAILDAKDEAYKLLGRTAAMLTEEKRKRG